MAGSLGGRSWRVRKLEGLDHNRERPAPSQTELEARALDAEIRELEKGCGGEWTKSGAPCGEED